MKRTITLEIAGAKYKLSSDADETHLLDLAQIVNDRIQALGEKAIRTAPASQLLAIVALGLAEDLEEEKANRVKLEAKTKETIQGVIHRIDQRINMQVAPAEED